MSSMDLLDVGQANEFKLACRRNGFSPEDLKWLCGGNNLASVRRVRLGHANIVISEHLIDCDADPFVPKGWKVEEHKKDGVFKWDATQVRLYFDRSQKNGKSTGGHELRKQLVGKPILNANVLDYLLKNPQLIPNKWKGKTIFFWGTLYRDYCGDPVVRLLCWYNNKWVGFSRCWISGLVFSASDPAALRAS